MPNVYFKSNRPGIAGKRKSQSPPSEDYGYWLDDEGKPREVNEAQPQETPSNKVVATSCKTGDVVESKETKAASSTAGARVARGRSRKRKRATALQGCCEVLPSEKTAIPQDIHPSGPAVTERYPVQATPSLEKPIHAQVTPTGDDVSTAKELNSCLVKTDDFASIGFLQVAREFPQVLRMVSEMHTLIHEKQVPINSDGDADCNDPEKTGAGLPQLSQICTQQQASLERMESLVQRQEKCHLEKVDKIQEQMLEVKQEKVKVEADLEEERLNSSTLAKDLQKAERACEAKTEEMKTLEEQLALEIQQRDATIRRVQEEQEEQWDEHRERMLESQKELAQCRKTLTKLESQQCEDKAEIQKLRTENNRLRELLAKSMRPKPKPIQSLSTDSTSGVMEARKSRTKLKSVSRSLRVTKVATTAGTSRASEATQLGGTEGEHSENSKRSQIDNRVWASQADPLLSVDSYTTPSLEGIQQRKRRSFGDTKTGCAIKTCGTSSRRLRHQPLAVIRHGSKTLRDVVPSYDSLAGNITDLTQS